MVGRQLHDSTLTGRLQPPTSTPRIESEILVFASPRDNLRKKTVQYLTALRCGSSHDLYTRVFARNLPLVFSTPHTTPHSANSSIPSLAPYAALAADQS